MITNTGGRDVVISQIQVRGQTCATLYDNTPNATAVSSGDDLSFVTIANLASGSPAHYGALAAVTGTILLSSGNTVIVYIGSPDSVSLNDIGTTIGITVFTSQAMYYKEANVQASGA